MYPKFKTNKDFLWIDYLISEVDLSKDTIAFNIIELFQPGYYTLTHEKINDFWLLHQQVNNVWLDKMSDKDQKKYNTYLEKIKD